MKRGYTIAYTRDLDPKILRCAATVFNPNDRHFVKKIGRDHSTERLVKGVDAVAAGTEPPEMYFELDIADTEAWGDMRDILSVETLDNISWKDFKHSRIQNEIKSFLEYSAS